MFGNNNNKSKPMNAAWLALACLVTFVLLVTTCCSVPVSRSITLFSMSASENGQDAGEILAGVLGLCFSAAIGLQGGTSGFSQYQGSAVICSPSTLGYDIVAAENLNGATINSIQDLRANTKTVVSQGLTQAMVFNPIGAAAAGLGVIIALIASAHKGRGINIAAAVLTAITAVCSWIAFGVNVGISAKVRSQINAFQSIVPAGQTLEFSWGAASFLPLGAAVVVSGALIWWLIAGPPRPEQTQTQYKDAEYRPSMATTDDADSKVQ